MAPKPRVPQRKLSNATNPQTAVGKSAQDAKSMPPPPVPPQSVAILEPEVRMLSSTLKDAAVKTGQIYSFYADTKRLGIARTAPEPPRSLTAGLQRDVQKYDNICDALDAYLLHAISVLQRDLSREEKTLREQEKALDEMQPPSSPTSRTDGSRVEESQPPSTASSSPAISAAATAARRPAAISMTSLQRPMLPLKLDLSSASLRMGGEEASLFSSTGLHSPITLAPKSARPNEYPGAILSGFDEPSERPVDIDLTLTSPSSLPMSLDPQLGSSADKPIDIDLDMDVDMGMDAGSMNDLFGDSTENGSSVGAVDDLFSPGPLDGTKRDKSGGEGSAEKSDDDFLMSLGVPPEGETHDFLQELESSSAAKTDGTTELSGSVTEPTAADFLAEFSVQADGMDSVVPDAGQFELDLDMFNPERDMDLMDGFSLGVDETETKENPSTEPTTS